LIARPVVELLKRTQQTNKKDSFLPAKGNVCVVALADKISRSSADSAFPTKRFLSTSYCTSILGPYSERASE
jgi:hypothetical protein